MRCPICNEKLQKNTEQCPVCGFRFPPEPTFIQKIMFLPIPEILFTLIIIAGICLLVYRFAIPTVHQEPILNPGGQLTVNTNVGVIFFDDADDVYIEDITEGIEKLNLEGNGKVKYKYKTDADCYNETISSLVNQSACSDIIITGSSYYDSLLDIAPQFDDTDFYVLWGREKYNYPQLENVQICRTDISKAVYSIGVNSAHHLTEKIKGQDVTNPDYSEINHTAVFLYKTDDSYSYYEDFVSGIRAINPNLGTYAVKVENEAEYADAFADSNDIYAIMVMDEMPTFTKTLSSIDTDNIVLSGVTKDVTGYPNYLCAIKTDNNTFVQMIFSSIASGEAIVPVFNGKYEDQFCRLEYNKAILGMLK